MIVKYLVKSGMASLNANGMRSVLTILGIVIGITSIILVMSLGQGAEDLILGQIQGIGSKVIRIAPGRHPKGPTDIGSLFSDSLKSRDLELLRQKANVPHAEGIMPVIFGGESVAFGSETYGVTIFGVSEIFPEVYDSYPNQGRIFSEEEVKTYSESVVIGSKVKEELFGNQDPLGQKIRIKGRNLRVIGLLEQKGQVSFINFDDAVIMPYTVAQQYIFGIKHFNAIVVDADEEQNVLRTVEDIKATLRVSHGIRDSEKDDFYIETQAQAMDMVSSVLGVLTAFLTSIAAISLVVGGIGIMNIMLVSVTERTREIGLRKALGATEKNILFQFLFEAVFLTVIGGFIGILFGAGLSFGASFALSRIVSENWSFNFPIEGAFWGLFVASLVGLVFGIYPARQAAKKNPIEALRYE
ncbi:MAG: hypothetical protein A2418_00975 [Candidatus Brennerbacteria bacterium RIFOXYC1_FULL_41_11]|uniref:Multidrug ABC transporter substrate-binding protein n=1 Tax=Candidatus Brennerbacteria bacterium RIFOXYD1_FULL_41_16 TaxID=1797529 RepID=A0A1G1XM45_9BACT|nr:MAG: ABC-type antimicrobial peptide transport system, permease component [Parcubacteria group bacterium GW2011_GWB1_41_4]OGY38611.1 MAG: hypothetical protein A2391_03405 [Candidatus Brennerbacteria bacterium RIFOXYB1_FULL_41_13]OGY38874.1 MAG: hypothetical protein A2418_00975 [Candidatus Brennerbacteria bacterium RIFOXYC1_FULL_41_11]OGY41032.1 MAG: hypothetical protein A2570_00100 [Candidatus Brennerbacteria bacterium RIFOXYD1_FULL_41_16]